MNPLGMPFQSDMRNFGGRNQIEKIMQNAKTKLLNIKPVLKIQSPRPHIKNLSPSKRDSEKAVFVYRVLKSPEFANVRATYRAISTIRRGNVDSNVPRSYNLIKKLSVNRKTKKKDFDGVVDHLQNIQNLQQRLERIYRGKIQDRRKNHFDCIAYPSLFFRRHEELTENFPTNPQTISRPAVFFDDLFVKDGCKKRISRIIGSKSI